MYLKIFGGVAKDVDPDEMTHSVVSDLGLHCLLRPVCPNTLVHIIFVRKKSILSRAMDLYYSPCITFNFSAFANISRHKGDP